VIEEFLNVMAISETTISIVYGATIIMVYMQMDFLIKCIMGVIDTVGDILRVTR
jgi:hypothetical protein